MTYFCLLSLVTVTSVSDLPLHTVKCCTVVFDAISRLLVIKKLSSLCHHQQTPPLTATSYECHQVATVRWHCVYNISRSQHRQHAMKPDNGRKQRFFHTPPAFDAPVIGGPRRNIAMTFGVEKLWLPGE